MPTDSMDLESGHRSAIDEIRTGGKPSKGKMRESTATTHCGRTHERLRGIPLLTAVLCGLVLASAVGCEEIVAVDESRIPSDAADPDGGATDEVSVKDATKDGSDEGGAAGDTATDAGETDSQPDGGSHPPGKG